jgi:hypothetical protein
VDHLKQYGTVEERGKHMPDLTNNEGVALRVRADWGAIWAGVFTFIAIWSVFGLLGVAVFGSAADPGTSSRVTGMSVGMGIWAIVLTIIAMYIAGLETGRLAAVASRHDGLIHGMIMFGLAVTASLVITIMAGNSLSVGAGVQGTVHHPYLSEVFTGLGWFAFVSLFLGWLAAMAGASTGVSHKAEATRNVREMRPAA